MPTLTEMFDYVGVAWHWGLLAISLLATTYMAKRVVNKILLSIAVVIVWLFFGSGLIGGFILLGIGGALSKKHNTSESDSNQSQAINLMIFLLALGASIGLTKNNANSKPSALVGDSSSYDAAQGLRGAAEKIPVPLSSKVIFRQDWNEFSMSSSTPTRVSTGYRWVIKSELPVTEIDKFYQSLTPPPAKEEWIDETRYVFKRGLSNINVKVDKKEGQIDITESRPPF